MSSWHSRTYRRGDVVWSIDPFRLAGEARSVVDSGDSVETGEDDIKSRPCLILSDSSHPFHGTQYLVVALTTTDRLISHPLTERHWVRGGTPKQSYISPWCAYSPLHSHIIPPPAHEAITDPYIGTLHSWFVDRVAEETRYYLTP